MAMANLISELVRVMGWDRNQQPPEGPATPLGVGGTTEEPAREEPRPILRSIFQPRFSTSPAVLAASTAPAASPPKKKTGVGYKSRADFAGRSAYVEYVQDNLKSGMMVRMLEDYEDVSAGDEGDFRYSNDGSPPVQVRGGHSRSHSEVTRRGHTQGSPPGQQSFQWIHPLLPPPGLLELPEQDLLGPLAHGGDPGHQPDGEGEPGEGHVPHRDPQTQRRSDTHLAFSRRTSCLCLTVLSVILSEPDLLLKAPWRSLLSALPGRRSLSRAGSPESG